MSADPQTIERRQQQLVAEFSAVEGWEERYRKIIALGRELPVLPDELRGEQQRVRGCQSQVWLHAELDDEGRVIFRADSDAMIVRGLIAMLLRVYSGQPPRAILSASPGFIEQIGLTRHLSPTRSNGLHAMLEQMVYYAKAFQTLLAARDPQR